MLAMIRNAGPYGHSRVASKNAAALDAWDQCADGTIGAASLMTARARGIGLSLLRVWGQRANDLPRTHLVYGWDRGTAHSPNKRQSETVVEGAFTWQGMIGAVEVAPRRS
jgi:hypothetical protein